MRAMQVEPCDTVPPALDGLRSFGNRCYLSICLDLGFNHITHVDLLIHFL